jgi:multicomponent Na+:H+ antiporter subunit E
MRYGLLILLSLALWMLLFWSVSPAVIVSGVVFAVAVGLAVGRIYPANPHKLLQPRRWFFAVLYLPYFVYYVVKANLDVMVRVLHPDVPIRPGIVKVSTSLQTDIAKTFLANSISLTPGTLTLDVDGQDLYVHWLNIDTDDPDRRQAKIVGRYEPMLRRIFE